MHANSFVMAGAGTATTSSEVISKQIAIPPSSVEEGEADPLITPAAWPAEATPGASMPQQPPSASDPSVSAASPTATTVKVSTPKSSRRGQRKGSPSPLRKGSKRKKKLKAAPRGGKAKADKTGNQSGSSTAAVVAEAAEQVDQEQPANADDRAVDAASVSLLGLAKEKRLAESKAAKEAKEVAEEEECRRIWYDYYANSMNTS